jgi:hypothetical protein
LNSAAASLSEQTKKIAFFMKEAIYSEYWIQNELAYHLPWDKPGFYFVDRGQGLAIPNEKPKYPDFVLRFGRGHKEPVFFLELKDLLTNTEKNRRSLLDAIEIIRRADHGESVDRWRAAKGSLADRCKEFADIMDSSQFIYGGIALGANGLVPRQISGYQIVNWPVAESWSLSLLLVSDK